MNNFELTNAGMLTTIQDSGRSHLQHLGIPASGPMDILAARLANILVGNESDAAVLEATYTGPVIRFNTETTVAITGAKTKAKLNGFEVDSYLPIAIKSGDTLDLSVVESGLRVYIAFAGGIQTEKVLDSRATYLPMKFGEFDRKLKTGDRIPIKAKTFNNYLSVDTELRFNRHDLYDIRIVEGPQCEYFEDKLKQNMVDSIYKVSQQSDRMGIRFIGTELITEQKDMISDGIPLGSVQITRGGQPIIMMADRQPTGGYPKIAKVIQNDIPKLAQLKPGDKIKFKWISISESLKLFQELEDKIDKLKEKINNQQSPNAAYRIYIGDKVYLTSLQEK
jgi:biotin-dependent carboxylase-like uncharacterized protein